MVTRTARQSAGNRRGAAETGVFAEPPSRRADESEGLGKGRTAVGGPESCNTAQ